MKFARLLVIASLVAAFSSAHAYIYLNLSSVGDPGLKGQAGTQFLNIGGPATANTGALIDFFPTTYFRNVSGTSSFSYTYEVNAAPSPASNALGVVIQGVIGGSASANYVVTIQDIPSSSILGSQTFTTTGPGTSYSLNGNINFAGISSNYRVTVASTLTVTPGGAGFVGTSLMEFNQQPVPEPATMTALGLGAVALLRRRKKA